MFTLNNTFSLNKDQYAAVNHPPDIPLQILAGPGSGKTKVLTARVAYLVQEKRIPPSHICAVTFTNKAANEMKERLKKLIGLQQTHALIMGTFHALCARFLRKYGTCISLPNNFTICDAEESKKIITKIMKSYADELSSQSIQLKEAAVIATISKAKAKGLSPHDVSRAKTPPDAVQQMIARIYEEYSTALRESNSLDFDDLLVYGVKLFTKEPQAIRWCRHVLVDEFQDTNSMQYELMVRLASAHRCVTVVGDPDQSIYGWRSAEVTNLGRMREDFPLTQQIFLEENYRSTGSILAASLAIVSQDKSRITKSLRTSHSAGALPTLQAFASEQAEGEFIAHEVKRLVAHSGGMLGWNDFVILLRFNALSRVTEAALQKEGIPNRVLAGQKFFERLEIKDIFAYLQVIDNSSYTPAFNRAAHTPPRGLGVKSISELTARAKKLGLPPMELAEQIFAGKTPDIKPPVKRKLESLVKPILALRKMANEGASVSDLIQRLLLLIDYEAHLKKSHQDWEARWENVRELINFASQPEIGDSFPSPGRQYYSANGAQVNIHEMKQDVIDLVSEDKDEQLNPAVLTEIPLRTFLQVSMLSTDVETKDDNKVNKKVTISTCHSAKGLEWPVVFVPAVEQGTFPFYRTEDVEEERRLLYVACTRAQGLLYLSHSNRRMAAGEWVTKELSEFVAKLPRSLFSPTPPILTAEDRCEVSKLIGREPIDEDVVQRKIQEYNAKTEPAMHDTQFQSMQSLFSTTNPVRSTTPTSVFDTNISAASFASARLHSHPPVSSSGTGRSNHRPFLVIGSYSTAASGIGKRLSGNASQAFLPDPSLPVSHIPPKTNPSLQPLTNKPQLVCTKALKLPHDTIIQPQVQQALSQGSSIKLAGGKRRLGMGRLGNSGFPNKKAKNS